MALVCALALVFPIQSCSPSHLHQGATAFGLDALLLVLACGPNYWPSSPALFIIPLSFSYHRLDASFAGGVRCLVHTNPFWGLPVETGGEPQRDESFAVRLLALLRRVKSGLCSRLCANAWRLLCLSSYSSWSSLSNARAVYLVRCDSSQFMSLCIGLLARAGGLIELLCNSCIVLRLLLICDVESALSLLAAVVSLLGCACGVRACFVVSCRVFS